jgi:integrase
MLHLGLRISEARNVRWSWLADLDSDNPTLTIPAAVAKNGSPRTLPLSVPLQILLLRLREKQHLGAPLQPPNDWPLVINRWGNPPTSRYIQRTLRVVSEKAINRRLRSHTFRHTFATELSRIAPIRVVQVALGHRSVTTTQKYIDVTLDDLRKAIDEKSRHDLVVQP